MKKRWVIVTAALIISAGAVFLIASNDEKQTGAQRTIAQSAPKLPCSATDRRSIVEALRSGYSGDVAAEVRNLRCSGTFAYGTVCVLCGPPQPGAMFGVLLVRTRDDSWRYLGSGGPGVIEQLAAAAGLDRSDLDELRGAPPHA